MKEKERFFSAKRLTGLAILLALVIVLQVWSSYFNIGATSLSFVLVPIVIGGMLYGVAAGAFLGLAFGVVTLMGGVLGSDPFTTILFNEQPFWTAVLCLGKGTAAGAASALVFRIVKGKNARVGTFLGAATAPIVNTGLFIAGSLLFLRETLQTCIMDNSESVVYYLIITCAGGNFLVELAINLICAPSLYTVARVIKRNKV